MKERKYILEIPGIYLIAVFVFYLGGSLVYSIDPMSSLYEIIRIASIFLVFVASYSIFRTYKDYTKALKIILLSSLIPLGVALVQLLTGTGLGGTADVEGRLYGTFAHPNSFASYLILILIIALFLVETLDKKKDSLYLVAGGLFFFIVFAIIETYSRGAWIAFFIIMFFYGAYKSIWYILLLAFTGIALFFISPEVHNRVEDIYNQPADSSIIWRLNKWQDVLDSAEKRPYMGWGTGTEIYVHEYERGFYAGNPYTHNDVMKLLLENGIIGVMLFVFIYSLILVKLFYRYRKLGKNDPRKSFLFFVIIGIIAEMVFSISDNVWRGTTTMWLMWALIGMAFALTHEEKIQKRTIEIKRENLKTVA